MNVRQKSMEFEFSICLDRDSTMTKKKAPQHEKNTTDQEWWSRTPDQPFRIVPLLLTSEFPDF